MLEGLNFSNETTFHVESTLGLVSGYLDQVNPVVSSVVAERLNAPLAAFNQEADIEPEYSSTFTPVKEFAVPTNPTNIAVAERTASPSKKSGVSLPVSASASIKLGATLITPKKPQVITPPSLTTDEQEVMLRSIRRNNLMLLTQGIGAKTQLARLTGLSPANISHRLHGNKHFDKDTADLFADKLQLSVGWLEVPHELADIPAAAQQLLALTAPSPVAVEKPKKAKISATPSNFGRSAELIPVGRTALSVSLTGPSIIPRGPALPPPSVVHNQRATVQEPIAQGQSPVVTVSPNPVTDSFTGLAPIAEALIKTLIGKARLGALSEEQACKILGEVMAS
ncbi:MAG: helix-turn-helix transcriptional regulator [Agitococcus sp.]|nr:helix-turn-helix transcriptional regulator [Agitococcus sp.]MDO9177036.1 helix-turn-helix transcriptional regulator [Agitococcus sp.]